MENNKFCVLVICGLCAIIAALYIRCMRLTEAIQTPVRDTVTVRDTVPFYYPKPRDSVVIRYDTIKTQPIPPCEGGGLDSTSILQVLPHREDSGGSLAGMGSGSVIIPITSHTYEGDGWRTHVSGFSPRLDSLLLFPERQTITIRDPPTTGGASSRWTLGVQAGYGITPRGMQPYLGVGLTWHFKLF